MRVATTALLSAGAATAWYTVAVHPYLPPAWATTPAPVVREDAAVAPSRDTQIAVWGTALAADTGSALVLGQLAALHAQRARETGAFDDYTQAEQYARHSLARRTQRNGAAAATLISVLLAQHRFGDAMEVADSLVRREPDIPVYQAIRGEVALELGRYDVARDIFTHLGATRTQPAIAPRVARWLEITGHVPEARRLLRGALAQVMARRDTPRETQAWFHLRLGDLEWRSGHPREAAAAYRRGLDVRADDARLLAAMAKLATHVGRGRDAVQWAERAVAAQADATTLLALASAQEAAGDSTDARTTAAAVQTLVTAQAGPPHREWLLWQLDHHQAVNDVLQAATQDLTQRDDIYGRDLVAWALHQANRPADARAMLQRAMALGTHDPLLQAHAEAIQ